MNLLDLGGDWEFSRTDGGNPLPAKVPGCVHTDLLANNQIDDPYYSDNEKKLMWIGETDWIYCRSFQVTKELLASDRVDLVCEGLDTLATIKINGRIAGKADNAFRSWRFSAKRFLKAGSNRIEILFRSTIPYIGRQQKKQPLALTGVGQHRIDGSNQIRKSQCNYGWDWGPMCVTCGIWKSIRLEGVETARFSDVLITQDHRQRGSVGLDIQIQAEKTADKSLSAEIILKFEAREIARQAISLADGAGAKRITVTDPQLWWPNGLGNQPLYDIEVVLLDAGRKALDRWKSTIGLRTIELDRQPDKWGESFRFLINGKAFFSKGANWIPADTFVTRITDDWYRYLVRSAAESNMNMLRVWGGGIYESDVFYDLCDEYGVLVWQDFMFACSAYPLHDEQFVASVGSEAAENIVRLRHHPSMALWCGNNEIEQMHETLISEEPAQYKMTWDDYRSVFDDLLPGLVKKLHPGIAYWPSSPHSPDPKRTDYNDPTVGDAHLWDVWHGRKPFEWYRTCEHRFNSEFGFQSFPEPSIVESYTPADERNITSYTMELHQRSGIGNEAIMQYMLSWFRMPTSFNHTLWLSQILQGMAIKYAVEHWRRKMPRGMGTLYWQLNDCWPVASWSSIDYPGNWKALHYMARDFYAPLMVSSVENTEKGTIELWVSNDLPKPQEGTVVWKAVSTDGKAGSTGSQPFKVSAGKSKRIKTVDLSQDLENFGDRGLLVSVALESAASGKRTVVSRNFTSFTRPKHLLLRKPDIQAKVSQTGENIFQLSLRARKPALWVWPDLPGVACSYSDRFFHLLDRESKNVTIQPKQKMNIEQVERKLVISSLVDVHS